MWRADSIAGLVLAQAASRPNSIAIRSEAGCVSFGALAAGIRRTARELREHLAEGEHLLLRLGQTVAGIEAVLAAEGSGHPATLLPARLPVEEFERWWRESGIACVLHPEERGEGRWRISTGGESHVAAHADIALFQLTSGSIGPPRLASRGQAGLLAEVLAVGKRLSMDASARVLCASSLAHSYGLIGGVLAPLVAGGEVTLGDRVPLGAAQGPTLIFGLGPLYERWLGSTAVLELSPNCRPFSAGAPLPPGLRQRFAERTGAVIRQDYGTSETGTITLDSGHMPATSGVGTPLPHLEVRLGGESGREVQVRGAAVSLGYLRHGKLSPCVDRDGWYCTGDLGAWAGDGLTLGGRVREPLHLGGAAVAPEQVERALLRLPGVREAIALPLRPGSEDSGMKVVLAASGLKYDGVLRWCRRNLPAPWQPDRIAIVEDLPRSPAGKVLRHAVERLE